MWYQVFSSSCQSAGKKRRLLCSTPITTGSTQPLLLPILLTLASGNIELGFKKNSHQDTCILSKTNRLKYGLSRLPPHSLPFLKLWTLTVIFYETFLCHLFLPKISQEVPPQINHPLCLQINSGRDESWMIWCETLKLQPFIPAVSLFFFFFHKKPPETNEQNFKKLHSSTFLHHKQLSKNKCVDLFYRLNYSVRRTRHLILSETIYTMTDVLSSYDEQIPSTELLLQWLPRGLPSTPITYPWC